MKNGFLITLILAVAIICSSCSSKMGEDYGSNGSSSTQQAPMANYSSENYGVWEGENISAEDYEASIKLENEIKGDKVIKNANTSISTKQFDGTIYSIKGTILGCGGYIESSSVTKREKDKNNRYFAATLKVPVSQFEFARQQIALIAKDSGKITSDNESVENVTVTYYNISGRLETKKTEEQRIEELINQTTEINSLIALEQRLTGIRTDIRLYEAQLDKIDKLSAYSTITVDVSELIEDEAMPVGISDDLGERMKASFLISANFVKTFFEELILLLASAIIPLSLVGLVCLFGYFINKKWKVAKANKGN